MIFVNGHKVSQVICLSCFRRWIAARPIDTRLDELECPDCHQQGIAIETGETSVTEELLKEQGEQIKNRDESLEKAREEIKWLRGMLKEQGWNLLTEDDDGIIHGLPGDDGQYLMTDGRDIWIDDYMDGVDDGIFLDSGRDVREIKAWMYMPKLPEEGR